MKAVEFVKKFGWDEAKKHLIDLREVVNQVPYKHSLEDLSNDLKKLIEAKELVEFGIPDLKKSMFSNSKSIEDVKTWLLSVSDSLLTEKGIKLKKALQLVESVNA